MSNKFLIGVIVLLLLLLSIPKIILVIIGIVLGLLLSTSVLRSKLWNYLHIQRH